MTDKQKLLAKVRKLFALSRSPEAAEAAAALAKATELMQQYGITADDVICSADDVREERGKSHPSQRVPRYATYLARMVADQLGCTLYWSVEGTWNCNCGSYQYKSHPTFVGFEANTTIANYAYTVLYRKLSVARREYRPKRLRKRSSVSAAKDTYALYWVNAVADEVCKLAPYQLTEQQQVVIERHMDTKVLKKFVPTNRSSSNVLRDAKAGTADGKSVTLNRGMNGTTAATPKRLRR